MKIDLEKSNALHLNQSKKKYNEWKKGGTNKTLQTAYYHNSVAQWQKKYNRLLTKTEKKSIWNSSSIY